MQDEAEGHAGKLGLVFDVGAHIEQSPLEEIGMEQDLLVGFGGRQVRRSFERFR